jgi:hypothetical protein
MAWYTLLSAIGCAAAYLVCMYVMPENSLRSFVVRFFLAGIVFGVIWLGATGRSEEFKYVLNRVKRFI